MRLGDVPVSREFVVHDRTVRGVRLEQIFQYTGARIFIVDARAQVDIEQALNGYDATRHCIIRRALVDEGVCPRRVLPTHPCHRNSHLCNFRLPPPEIPVKIFMIDLFGDDALFSRQHKIYHNCIRPVNMRAAERDCLDNMRTLMFAPEGTFTCIMHRPAL